MRIRSQQAGGVEATREVGFKGLGDSTFGSHPVASAGVGFAPSSSSPHPPPPPSVAEPQGLAGLFSGLRAGARSSSPAPQRPKAEPRGTLPAGAASVAGPTDRELLIAGMHQLQDAMSEMQGSRAERDGSSSPTNPEAVKPGISSFPAFGGAHVR